MNKNFTLKKLVYGAMIAAIYAALTIFLAPIGYGAVQCRLSEALTVLPFFSSFSVIGLTLGCLLSNVISPLGVLDMIIGTLATFLAAICTYYIGKSSFKFKRYLAPLPAVIVNGILIGLLINISLPKDGNLLNLGQISIDTAKLIPTMLLIALEELVPCYVLGLPLMILIEKNKKLKELFS